jgi:hypothetical protein
MLWCHQTWRNPPNIGTFQHRNIDGRISRDLWLRKKKSLELLMLDHLPRVNICIYTELYTYIKVFQYVNEIK